MSFSRRLRNVCLFILGGWLLIFAFTTTTAYTQGAIPHSHYLASLCIVFTLTLFFVYLIIYWRKLARGKTLRDVKP